MKCPKCIEEGKKSQVFPGFTSTTLMAGGGSYYDENGRYRQGYDPNTITQSFKCSNGHNWTNSNKPDIDTGSLHSITITNRSITLTTGNINTTHTNV